MPVTHDEIEQFQQFARQKLQNGGADSLEELIALWRVSSLTPTELQESLRALEEGLADADAGRVRPAADVFRDLAARYGESTSA